MIIEFLNAFAPDPDCLLREISRHVDDEILAEIAAADYGEDRELNRAALQPIRDSGVFPEKLGFVPMEVLELIRWSEPEDPDWKPGRVGEPGHWMRVFSCAAILRAEHPPNVYLYNDGSVDSTVIQMLLSIELLPVDLYLQACKSIAWLLLQSGPEGGNDSVRVYGVALLWCALHVAPKVPDELLVAFTQWVTRRADELNWKPNPEGRSGLREMVLDCQKQRAWEFLGVQLCEIDLSERSPELQEWIKLIGHELAG
jgi:hypothetical protein